MIDLTTRMGHDTVQHLIPVRISEYELAVEGEKPIYVSTGSVSYTRAWIALSHTAIKNVTLSIAFGRVSALVLVEEGTSTAEVEAAVREAQAQYASPSLAFDLTFQVEQPS